MKGILNVLTKFNIVKGPVTGQCSFFRNQQAFLIRLLVKTPHTNGVEHTNRFDLDSLQIRLFSIRVGNIFSGGSSLVIC